MSSITFILVLILIYRVRSDCWSSNHVNKLLTTVDGDRQYKDFFNQYRISYDCLPDQMQIVRKCFPNETIANPVPICASKYDGPLSVAITEKQIKLRWRKRVNVMALSLLVNEANVRYVNYVIKSIDEIGIDGISLLSLPDYRKSKLFIYIDDRFSKKAINSMAINFNPEFCSTKVGCSRLIDYWNVNLFVIDCNEKQLKNRHVAQVRIAQAGLYNPYSCPQLDCKDLDVDTEAVYTLSPQNGRAVNSSIAFCNRNSLSAMLDCHNGLWRGNIRNLDRIVNVCNYINRSSLSFCLIMVVILTNLLL